MPGETIGITIGKGGVIEEIEQLGRDRGFVVYFTGGTARRMVFGDEPVREASDLDLMVEFVHRPGSGALSESEKARRVREFKQELKSRYQERYPEMKIDIMNFTTDNFIFVDDIEDEDAEWSMGDDESGNWFLVDVNDAYSAMFYDARIATVDQFLIRKRSDDTWEISGEHTQDARAKIVRLAPKRPGESDTSRLTIDTVLRFIRLMAEYPDAEFDGASLEDISKFVDSQFENLI